MTGKNTRSKQISANRAPTKQVLEEIYRLLHSHYGPLRWWPTTDSGNSPTKSSKPQYRGGPKTEAEQLEVIVGAILTQNTSWKNVEQALANLFQHKLLSIRKLISVDQQKLAAVIKPSGYFNQKAIKLKAIAEFLRQNPMSTLSAMPIVQLRASLLSVHGVGPETADSIILYAYNKPIFVIDAYTKRITKRLGLTAATINYLDLQQLFMGNLAANAKKFNQFHALLVEHGKNTCRASKPLCPQCVISSHCRFYANKGAGQTMPLKT